MRIAYITETYPPEINGVALTVERTVSFLRARGHRLQLVRPRQPGEAARDDASEWRSFGLPIPVYRDLRFGMTLAGSLRQRWQHTRPDLVHLATPGPLGWAAMKAASDLGLPLTSDFRTNFPQYSHYYGLGWCEPWVSGLLRHLHNRCQRSFVPTQEARRDLEQRGFERLAVVGRGVDTQRFTPALRNKVLRESWGAKAGAPVLLHVGRLAAEKNVPLALRAFGAVQARVPAARMVVVGDGPMRKRWQAEHPQVLFVGARRGEALARCYASADIFLFPSLSDTFGNVVLEALASGLPVVSHDTAAAGEHVEHCESGLLVPRGDEAAFIAATGSIAQQGQANLDWMRQAARAAAERATWHAALTRFEAHLLDAAHAVETTHTQHACAA